MKHHSLLLRRLRVSRMVRTFAACVAVEMAALAAAGFALAVAWLAVIATSACVVAFAIALFAHSEVQDLEDQARGIPPKL